MSKQTKKKPAKKKAKRPYGTNIREKLTNGKGWRLFLEIENDVALKIVDEKESSVNGGEFKKIINNRLRKAYEN